jgi:hypothetical protein
MTSGAVIRLRPSELVGWIVGGLKPKRPNLIEPTKQNRALAFQIGGAQKPKARKPN